MVDGIRGAPPQHYIYTDNWKRARARYILPAAAAGISVTDVIKPRVAQRNQFPSLWHLFAKKGEKLLAMLEKKIPWDFGYANLVVK